MCKIRLLFFLGFLVFALLQSSTYAFQVIMPMANYSPPVIENNTKAVSIETPLKIKYRLYTFQVTNNSAKNIISIRVTTFYRKKSATRLLGGDMIEPILPSGKTMEIVPLLPQVDEKLPLETFSDPSEEPKVVISGLVFDDLTHEGDQLGNIHIAGQWLGYKIQAQRIIDIFQEALKNTEQDRAKVLESLRQQISMLTERADESDTKHLAQRLSPLTTALVDELKLHTSRGLSSLKQDMLITLAIYKLTDSSGQSELKYWLMNTLEFYEKRVKDLSVVY
jgi:hypothetical protein